MVFIRLWNILDIFSLRLASWEVFIGGLGLDLDSAYLGFCLGFESLVFWIFWVFDSPRRNWLSWGWVFDGVHWGFWFGSFQFLARLLEVVIRVFGWIIFLFQFRRSIATTCNQSIFTNFATPNLMSLKGILKLILNILSLKGILKLILNILSTICSKLSQTVNSKKVYLASRHTWQNPQKTRV